MAMAPESRIRWREPRDYVAARDRQDAAGSRWWSGLVGVLVTCAAVMALWSLARLVPGRNPPGWGVALMLAAGLGLFLSYVLPPLLRLCPSEVRLNRRGIMRFRGSASSTVEWSRIQSFELRRAGDHQLLCLRLQGGGEFEVALDAAVPLDGLEAFLAERIPG